LHRSYALNILRYMTELRLTGTDTLRAMAHPLRMRILGSLRVDGPATSAMLARRLGTDSGQTSHHLRMLARYGFVVDAPELGRGIRGRERWWKAGSETTRWTDDLGAESADAVAAIEAAARQVWDQAGGRYREQATAGAWSAEWRAAAGAGDFVVRTTPARLAALRTAIARLVREHEAADEQDAETVLVVLQAYPRRAEG
jgi:predicted ArsR family transcriptional regulator